MTTGSLDKKTATGVTYGRQGQGMDIDTMRKDGKCFRCGEQGHISKNCPLQSWNKVKKQEVRAMTTKPSTGSKVEEVKDTAGNGQTYNSIAHVSHKPHSILFAERTTNQPHKESHNRYATLTDDIETDTLSSVSDDKAPNVGAESPIKSQPAQLTKHLTSSALHMKVPGDRPPTIVVPLIMASPHARLERAGELGPNSPPEQVAPRAVMSL
ncbi:uncharacterized protein ARMOST_20938 [Armillaria ostoyae]|uniref:CCHC-type domain-containing protein n=1 Tax=Armillaria ostoyae TaxID=47428 RepID=A0A284S8S3_ARMOS|nr:uncharacterized protein ARMOST_20938 [Armillaria ostoyae]